MTGLPPVEPAEGAASSVGERAAGESTRPALSRLPRLLGEIATSPGGVYGLIVVTGMIVVSRNLTGTSGQALITVAATVVVFFAAHVFAVAIGSLAGGEQHGRLGLAAATRHGVSESIGMLVVSVLPIGLLLLGVTGILRHDDAVWLALAVDAVLLGVLGWVIAARRSPRFWVRLGGAGLTAAFGGVLILLKAFVHH